MPHQNNSHLKIRFLREIAGLALEQVALLTHLNYNEYCLFEDSGELSLSIQYRQLAEFFSIPVVWLSDPTITKNKFESLLKTRANFCLPLPLAQNIDLKLVGDKLFVIRNVHRLSQEQMANVINTSKQEIELCEKGKHMVKDTLTIVIKIWQHLKIDLSILFDNHVPMKEYIDYYLREVHCLECLYCLYGSHNF
uniref:hypothetical protein n=1 Tax=Candidatus Fimivicinus sp. TaxID=3056640 RepID=UPI00402555EB